MTDGCVFCKRDVSTRGHHVVPRCKGGRDVVPTCHSCEDFIHKTWTHNQLRDDFNTVEKILQDADSKNSSAGFTNSTKAPSSAPVATVPAPANRIVDIPLR